MLRIMLIVWIPNKRLTRSSFERERERSRMIAIKTLNAMWWAKYIRWKIHFCFKSSNRYTSIVFLLQIKTITMKIISLRIKTTPEIHIIKNWAKAVVSPLEVERSWLWNKMSRTKAMKSYCMFSVRYQKNRENAASFVKSDCFFSTQETNF